MSQNTSQPNADRYQVCFENLKASKQGAFVPFVTLGDPSPDLSMQILETLVDAGADALELGLPFSDPLADGPTIQGANVRSLDAGTTPAQCFEMIEALRQKHPDTPIGLLVYANLVFANGVENFYQRCQQAGVDSVLIADVPLHESAPYVAAANKFNVAPIFIAPPNADDATLKKVAELGKGYTYLLSRAGVTGAETKANMPIDHVLEKLETYQAAPPLLGFGISEPAQVKAAIDAGATGAISGSAVVKIIEENKDAPSVMLEKLAAFVRAMKAASLG